MWYCVYRSRILRQTTAPNRDAALAVLKPIEGEQVVSKASFDLSTGDNVVQRCGYGCGRPSVPDQKGCGACTAQRAKFRVRP